jgi:ribosomal protein S25
LVGHEKNLLFLVFNECSRIGSLITPEITLSHICEALRINSGVAKMVIYRLTQKGILTRAKSKTGRGGWIKFGLTKELYQDLRIRETDNKEATNRNQTDNKQVTKRVTEQITSPLVSKLDNINTNLTNTDTVWNLSMIEHVEKYGINGGVIKRAREISPNLEIDQVCNVIEKFMLCMEGSASKEIKNKIAFFLSLTKKAASGEEILPEIETDTDRLMRELVTKAQETLKNRAELEEQLLEVSFQEWIGSLSGEQKLEIVPSSTLVKEGSHPHTQQFKIYYRENLWPQEKRIMLQGKA